MIYMSQNLHNMKKNSHDFGNPANDMFYYL